MYATACVEGGRDRWELYLRRLLVRLRLLVPLEEVTSEDILLLDYIAANPGGFE